MKKALEKSVILFLVLNTAGCATAPTPISSHSHRAETAGYEPKRSAWPGMDLEGVSSEVHDGSPEQWYSCHGRRPTPRMLVYTTVTVAIVSVITDIGRVQLSKKVPTTKGVGDVMVVDQDKILSALIDVQAFNKNRLDPPHYRHATAQEQTMFKDVIRHEELIGAYPLIVETPQGNGMYADPHFVAVHTKGVKVYCFQSHEGVVAWAN